MRLCFKVTPLQFLVIRSYWMTIEMLRLTLMGGHWGITWILLQYSLIIFVSSKKQRSLPVRKDFALDFLVLLFSFLSLLFWPWKDLHAYFSFPSSFPFLTFHSYLLSLLLLFLFRICFFPLFPKAPVDWSRICAKITNWPRFPKPG